MSRPLLLDLFCCQGGASRGYVDAGFDVIGVDIVPQPRYPYDMIVGDAVAVLRSLLDGKVDPTIGYALEDIDAIHASPPCQRYTTGTNNPERHPDLVGPVRDLLMGSGVPWVIENVPGAPLIDAVQVCGSAFDLAVRRHRKFESNVALLGTGCDHRSQGQPVGVYGDHPDRREYRRPDGTRRGSKARGVGEARLAMGMEWADWHGLREAIPPAYTAYIGRQLMTHVREEVAA